MTTSVKENREIAVKEERAASFDGALGIFSTLALLLLLWGFCWLKSYSSFTLPQYIYVRFNEVAGLTANAGVFVEGVRIGIVDKIEWKARRDVIVTVRINSDRVIVPNGSKFLILTNGIVGAKYVEIRLPQNSTAEPIDSKQVVIGEDPVRPELAVNNLAIALSEIDVKELRRTLAEDHDRIVRSTEQVNTLVSRSLPLIDQTIPLEKKAIVLADDMSKISKKLSRLVDNPNFSGDLKETASQIRQTMVHVQDVVKQVDTIVQDKSLRNDIYGTLEQLNKASTSMEKSMSIIQSMSADEQLRGDVKQMLKDARTAMTKVDKIVTDPEFGLDLKNTLIETRTAVDHIDDTAKQLNQILDKRSPLLHLMFGRPGKLKNSDKSNSPNLKSAISGLKETTKSLVRKKDSSSAEGTTSSNDSSQNAANSIDTIESERPPVPPNLAPSTKDLSIDQPADLTKPIEGSHD